MKAEPDLLLIDQALEGNKEAFNWLARKHYAFCLLKAGKLVKDTEVAKDLVQNALLEAYFKLQNLQNKEAFKQWLGGIVQNVCKNYIRDAIRKHVSLKQYYETTRNLQEKTEEEKIVQVITEAINSLDKKYGKIVYAFYYEQKSILDICKKFSLTKASVKVRLHRARKELKTILECHAELQQYQQYINHHYTMKQVRIIDMVLGGANQESCSLLLYDDESCRVLPIIIMKEEAQAMLSAMKNINYPRPMTFNLMAQIIRSNHVHPQGAYITDISEGIFMAHLKMKQGKRIKEYDARPSDAITIALLFDCPILVSHKVLDTAGLPVPDQYKNSLPREKGMDYLAQLVEASLADMKTKIAASKIKTPVATIEKQINNLMKYIFEEA